MIVEIIKDSTKQGYVFPIVGEFYKAKQYRLDGNKVTLIYQVDEITHEKLGYQHYECSDENPLINEYKTNIKYIL